MYDSQDILVADDRPFTSDEHRLLRRLQTIVDRVTKDVVTEQMKLDANEPIITLHVIRAIRQDLGRRTLEVGKTRVEVLAQDFNPMGPTSPERVSGADFYISIVRYDDGQAVSKGI